jgi:hypothetical protein
VIVEGDGARGDEELFEWIGAKNVAAPRPFDLSPQGRQVCLMLFGSGLRGPEQM